MVAAPTRRESGGRVAPGELIQRRSPLGVFAVATKEESRFADRTDGSASSFGRSGVSPRGPTDVPIADSRSAAWRRSAQLRLVSSCRCARRVPRSPPLGRRPNSPPSPQAPGRPTSGCSSRAGSTCRRHPDPRRVQQEHSKHFDRKVDAQRWLDEQTSKLVTGTHVTPRQARTTVGEWCDTWLEGYRGNRASTVRQAEVHIARIRAAFGPMQLAAVRPSHVRTWCAQLAAEGLADSYVYALHARLAQLYADAVHDGLVAKSPCSRRTSPTAGKQRAYVATTEQVWALHDVMPEHLRPAVLIGAFSGLRLAEACGLRVGRRRLHARRHRAGGAVPGRAAQD